MDHLASAARRQRVLADFGDFALGSDDIDAVLTEACRLVAEALGTDRAKVLEIQAGGRELLVRAGVGWRPEIVGRLRLSMDEASSETFAIRAGRPVVTRDVREETRFRLAGFMRDEGVCALANVPILVPGRRVYGLLQVDATEPRDFTEEDTEFLRTYAAILGPVVDRLHKLERLREAEERAQRRELRFRTIFDTAPVGLSVIDPEGRFLRVNAELARILARSREELATLAVPDVTLEEDVPPSVSALERCLATGGTASLDKRYRRPGGELVSANSTLTPLRTSDGSPAILAVTVDLSARLRAEEALRESEERFRSFAETSTDTLWIVDARTRRLVYLSPAFERIWGERREAVLADLSRWAGMVHPEDRDMVQAALPRAAAGESVQVVYRILRADDGRVRWIQDRGFPIRDAAGEISHVGGISQDVTAQRETAERLRENQRRLWTVIEGIPQLVWRSDGGGGWTWASPQWSAYTGQTMEEARGLGWLDALHPEDRERALEGWRQADGSSHLDMETRLFHAGERRHRWFQTRALPVRDEEGRVVEWLGTSTDIDDLRQLQDRQNILVAELQHRTRNLLGVVRSMADRIAVEAPTIGEFMPPFRERLDALSRVNGLLSRLEHGQRITFDELLRTELGARGFLDASRGERVVLDGPAGVRLRSATVQTFALAIHELATNAVKYGALANGHGRLRVLWRLHRDEAGRHRLQVEWIESGVADMPRQDDAPKGGGYGRMLIERALPYQLQAKTSYVLGPDGVRCMIDLPLR